MKKPFNWKIFFILLAASIFGVVAVIPYSLALQGNTLNQSKLPMPLWMLIPLQVIQNGVIFAIIIGIWLWQQIAPGLACQSWKPNWRANRFQNGSNLCSCQAFYWALLPPC
jgi:hypothetical protein